MARKLKPAKKQTVRERSQAGGNKKDRRIKPVGGWISQILAFLRREYYLPLPDNKVGRFLNKRRYIIPRYFKDAFEELKQVTWPSRKETWKLTFAVFLFAVIFGVLVAIVDYGLENLFRKVILKV